MRYPSCLAAPIAASLALFPAACGNRESHTLPIQPAVPVETASAGARFPASLAIMGDGYPHRGDACRRLGESSAVSNLLDHRAVLVGCPHADLARRLGGKIVGVIDGITLVSIPMDRTDLPAVPDAARGSPARGTAPAAPKEMAQDPKAMVEKCLARVNSLTGGKVIGVSRSEQAGSGVMIHVKVRGADAAWKCFGNREGMLEEVYYGGDEGAL